MIDKPLTGALIWTMLWIIIAIIVVLLSDNPLEKAYAKGWNEAIKQVPSCLYVDKSQNKINPWGYDGKECINIRADGIVGGGLFISLQEWKEKLPGSKK